MSKAIKWQIAFQTNDPSSPTSYRIDIYAEGYTGNPIQLMAGPQPFITDENDDKNFFAPIRSQTGTIQVCTRLSDGSILDINDLLPADNIAHPVRLINLSNSNAIEWQGFMSCEAFSQAYTEVPEIFSFPVLSVLEAMASVQLDPTRSSGLQTVYVCLPAILKEIDIQSGMTCFTHLNYSRTDYRILSKYIDMTVMFEQKEYNNENSTTYIVSGLSAKDALTRLCTYMGWIAREKGSELYLQRIGEEIGMYREEIDEFPGIAQQQSITEAGIAATFADKWMGTDHKRTISQGAKSVEVVASLKKYAIDLGLPPFPYGETYEIHRQYNGPTNWIYILASLVNNPYNNVTLNYYKATISYVYGSQSAAETTTLTDLLEHLWDAEGIVDIYSGHGTETVRSGAFFAKVAYENQDQSAHSTSDGLFVSWLPRVINTDYSTQPIFAMRSLISYNIGGGYLKLSASLANLVVNFDNYFEVVWITKETDYTDSILMHIRFGNKYWNGSQWVDSFTKVWVDIEGSNFKKNWTPTTPVEETDGYLIPLSNNSGELEIAIYPQNNMPNASHNTFLLNTFFGNLGVEYMQTDDDTLTDRSENRYFRLLGTNFRDEISVNTDLASTLNNQPSPSLIMNSAIEAMTELNYGTDQVPDMRRPEVDLLNRLADYYQAARQRLSLIVEHPTAAPLPLLRLNGISPDTRKYLPLAESRDWREETCTLTCFETPTE